MFWCNGHYSYSRPLLPIHNSRSACLHSYISGSCLSVRRSQKFLHERRVVVSQNSPNNPQGNGLCERYNRIIWKTVQLALANWKMSISKWESIIFEALNTIRTLLCTSTNATPHKRFFSFQRQSSTCTSLPSWFAQPGIISLKHHVCCSKHDPLVSKVKLIEANPQYAQIDSPVKLGDQIPRTSSSDTLPNESDYLYEPSSTSNSEERLIPQKRPHPTLETDTYFSDTQQMKHKKNGAVSRLDPLPRNVLIMITVTCHLMLTTTSYLNNQDVPKGPAKCQVIGKTWFYMNNT